MIQERKDEVEELTRRLYSMQAQNKLIRQELSRKLQPHKQELSKSFTRYQLERNNKMLRRRIDSIRQNTTEDKEVLVQKRKFILTRATALEQASQRLHSTQRVANEDYFQSHYLTVEAELRKEREALAVQRRQLIGELITFFPISTSTTPDKSVVVNITLANSGNFTDVSPNVANVALRYILQLLTVLRKCLQMHSPFEWSHSPAPYICLFSRGEEKYLVSVGHQGTATSLAVLCRAIVLMCRCQGDDVTPAAEIRVLPNLLNLLHYHKLGWEFPVDDTHYANPPPPALPAPPAPPSLYTNPTPSLTPGSASSSAGTTPPPFTVVRPLPPSPFHADRLETLVSTTLAAEKVTSAVVPLRDKDDEDDFVVMSDTGLQGCQTPTKQQDAVDMNASMLAVPSAHGAQRQKKKSGWTGFRL
eukprot:TRINITY_DN5074_c0_g1_i2.p1 TRINITY_DN5074_c0_g1~~TRINITY_DN5074_c0_g1_i2.p1  ORF type:complete len:448 (-),score=149.02 TRINITY_DN5074_c0_g1_i2:31-1281(-)